MAAFLEKLASLYTVSRSPPSTTVSVSSRWQPQSDQTTRLDDDGFPIIAPLHHLDQVLSWVPGHDDICVPSVRLSPSGGSSCDDGRRQSQDGAGLMSDCEARKMIVCHDMMGGYTKDKYVQGQSEIEDFYFYDWSHIGAFIYFSHHFISIPPPGWTNATHRNGVLSMGTVITEWQDGAKVCHSLLSDEFKVMQFAQQLVAIAQYYRFDGWLVNIENPIHPMLLERVYMLLSLLTTGMHDACPGSRVIWYDSVTIDGQLKWQNQLNQLNRSFFDVCDGIFLNYNWSDSGLSSSRFLAGERQGEVYVGIDVFGRGCYGYRDKELGFDSCKALEAINRHGLSSALFAPGWVFENLDKRSFFNNQDRFCSSLNHLCPTASLTSLPLVSSFGRGCGERMTIDGKTVYSGTWSNHSAQDVQPSYLPASGMLKNDLQSAVVLYRATVDTNRAYNNGACLKLEGRLKKTAGLSKPSLVRLFKTDISLSVPLLIAYTFNTDDQPSSSSSLPTPTPSYKYFLQLHTSGSPARVFLDPLAKPVNEDGPSELLKGCGLPRSRDVPRLPGCVLSPLPEKYTNILHEIFTGSSEQPSTWKTCYFVVDRDELRGLRLTEISLGFYVAGGVVQPGESVTLTVGEIKILDINCLSPTFDPSTISNVWCNDVKLSDDKTSLSLTLFWNTSDNPQDPIDHYNIYSSNIIGSRESASETPWKSDYVYLGRAHSNAFRVNDLYILSSNLRETPFSLEFRVQPVTTSRRKPSVLNSECLFVEVNQ